MTEERRKLKPLDAKGRRMMAPERFGDALERACPTEEPLKPCPFCGVLPEKVNEFGLWLVACDKCGADSGIRSTEAQAIAAWNRRALDDYVSNYYRV